MNRNVKHVILTSFNLNQDNRNITTIHLGYILTRKVLHALIFWKGPILYWANQNVEGVILVVPKVRLGNQVTESVHLEHILISQSFLDSRALTTALEATKIANSVRSVQMSFISSSKHQHRASQSESH